MAKAMLDQVNIVVGDMDAMAEDPEFCRRLGIEIRTGPSDHLGEIARFGADLGLDYMLFRPLQEQTVADRRFELALG